MQRGSLQNIYAKEKGVAVLRDKKKADGNATAICNVCRLKRNYFWYVTDSADYNNLLQTEHSYEEHSWLSHI